MAHTLTNVAKRKEGGVQAGVPERSCWGRDEVEGKQGMSWMKNVQKCCLEGVHSSEKVQKQRKEA